MIVKGSAFIITTPKLRFKGFNEPWENKRIIDISIYGNGDILENKLNDNGKYNVITLGSVSSEGNIKPNNKKTNEKNKLLNKNDLVMILSFHANGIIGMNAIIPENNSYVLNQRMGMIRVKDENNPYFMHYMLNNIRPRFERVANGLSQLNLSKNDITHMKIIIPSTKEQTKIGLFFNKLDKLIVLQQDKVNALKSLKNGYLQKLFAGMHSTNPQLRFKGFNGNWDLKKIEDIGSVKTFKRIFKNETKESGEIPFYKIGTFGKEATSFISNEKYQEYRNKYPYPHIDDILISASGTLGRTVIYKGENAYFQDSNIIWLDTKNIDKSFLYYLYKTINWGVSEGSTIKRLYNKNVLNTDIKLPPTAEEQTKIGSFMASIDKQITSQEDKLNHLKATKRGFLQKLFV